jgi:hypothetical protein
MSLNHGSGVVTTGSLSRCLCFSTSGATASVEYSIPNLAVSPPFSPDSRVSLKRGATRYGVVQVLIRMHTNISECEPTPHFRRDERSGRGSD